MKYLSILMSVMLLLLDAGCDSGSGMSESASIEDFLLVADGVDFGAEFGKQVAISGDHALITAPGDSSDGTGNGSVFTFRRMGDEWVQEGKLKRTDDKLKKFGLSVAADGDTAIIGGEGAAFIYEYSGGGWIEKERFDGPLSQGGNSFGKSVALNDGYAIVGAPDVTVSEFSGTGLVSIYRHKEGAWENVDTLQCRISSIERCGRYGQSVAIGKGHALVGVPDATFDSNAKGAVYLHQADSSGLDWNKRLRFTSDVSALVDESSVLGTSVAFNGESAIVGGQSLRGALIIEKDGEDWANTQTLMPDFFRNTNFAFGWDVKITERYAVVSDLYGSASSQGEGRDAVFLYERRGPGWRQIAKFAGSTNTGQGDFYGYSIALSGDYLVIGAPAGFYRGKDSGVAYIAYIPSLL